MKINHEEILKDGLTKLVHSYYWHEHTLELDYYLVMERKTKRHKFKIVRQWQRLFHRISNMEKPCASNMVREEVLKLARCRLYIKD